MVLLCLTADFQREKSMIKGSITTKGMSLVNATLNRDFRSNCGFHRDFLFDDFLPCRRSNPPEWSVTVVNEKSPAVLDLVKISFIRAPPLDFFT